MRDIQCILKYLKGSKSISYEIIQAGTLRSAFNLMCRYEIDIVLLDLYLPDSKGLETLRKFIAVVSDKPVIVLSEIQSEKVAIQAVRYGAQDYLEKSQLSRNTLNRSIRYSMERMDSLMDKSDLLNDLNMALQHIKMQEGLLRLCIGCKKIRGKNGKWYTLKDYARLLQENKSNYLICPSCKINIEKEN